MTTFEALGVLTEMRAECVSRAEYYRKILKDKTKDDEKAFREEQLKKYELEIEAIDKVGSLLTKR